MQPPSVDPATGAAVDGYSYGGVFLSVQSGGSLGSTYADGAESIVGSAASPFDRVDITTPRIAHHEDKGASVHVGIR